MSRPNCKSDSGSRGERSNHRNPFTLGKKPAIQDAEARLPRIEQDETAHHVGDVQQARERWLPLLDSFLIARRPNPIRTKDDPCRLDDLKWRKHFKISHSQTNGPINLLFGSFRAN